MIDYREFDSVEAYRRACGEAAADLNPFLCWTLGAMMRRREMTFPEAVEEAVRLGTWIPTDPGLIQLLNSRGIELHEDGHF